MHFLTIMCSTPRPKENKKRLALQCISHVGHGEKKKQLPLVRLEFTAVKKVDGGGWAAVRRRKREALRFIGSKASR